MSSTETGLVTTEPSELTFAERATLMERFYWRCYRASLDATLALAAIAVLLACLNSNTQPYATGLLAIIVGLGTRLARTPARYRWLRRHPTALAFAGPLAAGCALWPATDANALYFPALAPLAIIACVAQRRRDTLTVIVSIAAGTFLGGLVDTRFPALAEPAELASATLAVGVVGALMTVLVNWCAKQVALTAQGPGGVSQVSDAGPSAFSDHRHRGHGSSRSGAVAHLRPAADLEDPSERTDNRRFPFALLHAPAFLVAIRDASKAVLHTLRPRKLEGLTDRSLQVYLLLKADLTPGQAAAWLGIKRDSLYRQTRKARFRSGYTSAGILDLLPDPADVLQSETDRADHR